ncbi:MAG: aspartate carbamoyltransferase catalytic subunit [Thermodesulfobacteriota bacterium]|nr:aspartate carbamoyltransferase catalytic subunit [Thermodesulfobacteriota bacterium]
MELRHKDLLGMEDLSPGEITLILDTAESFKEVSEREIKKVPTLRGKTIILFFYEPGTRTRTSFEVAAKRLSADTFNLSASTSSMVKGETLIDTARNLEAMTPDAIVIRHSSSGAPHLLAGRLKSSVINAGDGAHSHPSQALLDMLTMREAKGRLEGLNVAIIGDIAHSRVARSNMIGLSKMGARVRVAGPPSMMPLGLEQYGAKVFIRPEPALEGADVIMMLRLQLERQKAQNFPGVREYAKVFGLNRERVSLAGPEAIIMHPGPMNRGVEIAPEVADGPGNVILDQVTNGVAVRMALLYLFIGGGRRE